MRIKTKERADILSDIIKDAKHHPKNWKAVFGKDQQLLSDDYYLFHPNVGLYLIKEYNKNPYQRRGVGGQIGRRVDDHIENEISKHQHDFGIIHGDIRTITHHLNKGVHPRQIINAAIHGKNMGLTMPIRGQGSESDDSFRYLRKELSSKQQQIEHHLKKMAEDDGLYHSY